MHAIETERYTPSLPLAFALARFFEMSIEEIFNDDREPTQSDDE